MNRLKSQRSSTDIPGGTLTRRPVIFAIILSPAKTILKHGDDVVRSHRDDSQSK
jgi:hypothetical protein